MLRARVLNVGVRLDPKVLPREVVPSQGPAGDVSWLLVLEGLAPMAVRLNGKNYRRLLLAVGAAREPMVAVLQACMRWAPDGHTEVTCAGLRLDPAGEQPHSPCVQTQSPATFLFASLDVSTSVTLAADSLEQVLRLKGSEQAIPVRFQVGASLEHMASTDALVLHGKLMVAPETKALELREARLVPKVLRPAVDGEATTSAVETAPPPAERQTEGVALEDAPAPAVKDELPAPVIVEAPEPRVEEPAPAAREEGPLVPAAAEAPAVAAEPASLERPVASPAAPVVARRQRKAARPRAGGLSPADQAALDFEDGVKQIIAEEIALAVKPLLEHLARLVGDPAGAPTLPAAVVDYSGLTAPALFAEIPRVIEAALGTPKLVLSKDVLAFALGAPRVAHLRRLGKQLEAQHPGLAAALRAGPSSRRHALPVPSASPYPLAVRYLYWMEVASLAHTVRAKWSRPFVDSATRWEAILKAAPGLIIEHRCPVCGGPALLDLRLVHADERVFNFLCLRCLHEASEGLEGSDQPCRCRRCVDERLAARRQFRELFPLALAAMQRAMRAVVAPLIPRLDVVNWDFLTARVLGLRIVGEKGGIYPRTLHHLRKVPDLDELEFRRSVSRQGVTVTSFVDRFFIPWSTLQYLPLDQAAIRAAVLGEPAASVGGSLPTAVAQVR